MLEFINTKIIVIYKTYIMKKEFMTTSRIAGLLYLGLAITGMLAFLFSREKLYIPGDALSTATNFATQQGLARFGIASELALVIFQSLSALYFFKLFRKINLFAAISLATFGTINTIIILIANAFWLNAFMVATKNGTIPPTIDQANTTLILFEIHENLWIVGKLFFGLWLIPMGYLAGLTNMPKLLKWTLIGGGIGYVLSLFLSILAPNIAASTIEMITVPATIGEFWMIGYLLFKKQFLHNI